MAGVSTVLVTGAAGYLGSRLARHFPQVVATDRSSAELGGDDDPFAAVDPRPITRIVHAAAATRFDVDAGTAYRSNVRATEQVVAFARRCPRLESLTVLSTIYASGLAQGPIAEAPLPDRGFANNYEQSKWAAEQVVIASDLPWRVARLATVIADDRSGAVTQHNAFHRTLDLWFHGLLPVLPGRPDTPLYVISGRYATEAVVALTAPGHDGVYHLAPCADATPPLADIVGLVAAAFEEDATFRGRRVDRPPLVDQASFDLLAGAVGTFRASLAGQAVAALAPFARQLYSVKQVETGRLRTVAPDDPRQLVSAACRWLVRTRWGRHGVA